MGCIGDGKYDNTKSFKALNNAIAKSTKERIIVEFSAGIYSTFQGLEVYGKKKVCIKGNNTTIKKIAPRWSVDNLAIYIVDTKNIEVEDLSIDMRVIDANTPTKEAYRYYAIWCRMDNVPAEKIDIHGCTFIDNLSVPNSMVKPYNGTIWLGSYGTRGCNATISRNIFENSCGRVIYTTNMSNIKIVGNVINNASPLLYDCKYINQELICFRQIGCDHVLIRDNKLKLSPKAYRFASHKIFEVNCNDNDFVPLRNCEIANNYIDCSELPGNVSCIVLHLESGDGVKCYKNTVILNNSDNSYFTYFNKSQKHHLVRDIQIEKNVVKGVTNGTIFLRGVNDTKAISVSRNTFYVDREFDSLLSGEDCNTTSATFSKNKVLKR